MEGESDQTTCKQLNIKLKIIRLNINLKFNKTKNIAVRYFDYFDYFD